MQQFRYYIRGAVQGVGFRHFVYQKAQNLKLKGYVKNLPDGSVECVAVGNQEQLTRLETALKHGPAFSRVGSVTKQASHQLLSEGFSILY